MTVTLNLNVQTRVVLTEAGARRWNAYWTFVRPRPIDLVKAGEEKIMPLWEVMLVFGPQMIIGSPASDLPFLNNEILVEA